MGTLLEDIKKIRDRRESLPEPKDLIPTEAELKIRKTILEGGSVIGPAPKKSFFDRAKDFIMRNVIRTDDPESMGFTQADVDKIGAQNFIQREFGSIGKTFPFLFKKESDKVTQRIDALIKTGTDPERANKIAIVDVIAGKGGMVNALAKQQALRQLELTSQEKKVLNRKRLVETGGFALDAASFVPIGSISRVSKLGKAKPVINALRKGEDVVEEGIRVGNKFKNVDEFVKAKGIDPASISIKDSKNLLVENTAGNDALLLDIPIKDFGKPKFETLNQDVFKPGRKITDPIEATLVDGKYRITDGANRFTQAVANGDETIPVVVEVLKGKKFLKGSDLVDVLKGGGKKPPTPPKSIAKQASEFSKNTPQGVPFEIADETRAQWLQRQLQDKMNRLEGIQKAIVKAGGKIDEGADAYLAQELYVGKAAENIDTLQRYLIKDPGNKGGSFLERLTKEGINVDEFGKFLQAKHAAERNAQVALRNVDLLDGGSGMLTKEAEKLIVEFTRSGKIKALEKFGEEFYKNITRARLKLLVDSGLETAETAKKLEKVYKNYVPLKVADDVSVFGQRGKGFSVQGKDIKRAKGSTKERANPFVQAILDYENTLIKAEKNKVAQTFLKLVRENPNEKLWKAERMKYRPRFDKTGEVVSMDPKFKFADNVLEVREKGKIWTITIEDPALAQAMKNLGTERGIGFLNVVNNYLRGINTFMNPEFMITNFERDIQTALINIGGEHGGKLAKNVFKDVKPAMGGIWRNVRGKSGKIGKDGTDWGALYQEMKEQGGRVGWFEVQTVEQKTDKLISQINRYQSKKGLDQAKNMIDAVGEFVVSTNEVVESAVRLSAYKNAVEAGMTKAKAAQLAKNLTVNFNKKGNWGVALNTLYLFANAGIQGSARIFKALKNPRTRRIVGGAMAGVFAINEANRIINEEEFKKIPDYVKDTNLIFMLPGGDFIKIRLPYGYNIFKSAADVMGDIAHGDTTPGEAMKRMVLAADAAFNPLSSGTLLQFLSPTVLDPITQQMENKNFFGAPIKPEQPQFGRQKPDSQLYWRSVREPTKEVTKFLNEISGGSEVESGLVDVSPELVDHWWDFLTGGVGKFVANSLTTGQSVLKGDLPDTRNMPFVRQMVGVPFEEFERTELFRISEKSEREELTSKDLEEFKINLKKAYQTDQIDAERAQKLFDSVNKNQARIFAGRVLKDMKKMTPEEKKKAFKELSPLEQKEFDKLLKKQLEQERGKNDVKKE